MNLGTLEGKKRVLFFYISILTRLCMLFTIFGRTKFLVYFLFVNVNKYIHIINTGPNNKCSLCQWKYLLLNSAKYDKFQINSDLGLI